MKSLASWLSIMFLGMFWLFRIAVTLATELGNDFGGFIVFNKPFEIALLFVTLLCIILIARRMLIGPIIYLIGYGWYFGSYILSTFLPAITAGNGEQIDIIVLLNGAVALLQLLIGASTLLIMAYEKTKLKHFSDNKTDWYFDTDKYDRKYDERADKNQYRTL